MWSGTGGQEKNQAASLWRLLFNFLRLFFVPWRLGNFAGAAMTAALILSLLVVLALGMRQQPFTKETER
jgi:hypothetical protein